ncbi:ParB/RepB/Spo0J family partition protein [Streptomyces tauricus]|uniref:ParB/RepB/Spo0J family partition protein n=1 Tax=Streptomyces tauricus TaxID=68274 RepID=UPI0022431C6C|nr:ParB N-terminal domain-containing protein [Streptomyces tauricus]MCW8103546.1 ParB N-terminal domain-containing protein [Streptomyces tauricus]
MSTASQAKKTAKTPTGTASATPLGTAQPQPSAPDEAHDQIVRLEPALIVRDDYNARTTATEPDDDLKASVAELGVQDPIHVRPQADGTYGAFKGWRRAQAQQAANATAKADDRPIRKIPAIIRADLVGNDAMTHLLSLIENDHREQMHDRDRVKAIETLALIDVSEEQREAMARALKIKRAELRAAREAGRLDDTQLRRARGQGFDLMQMAEMAEVRDVSQAVAVLESAHAKDAAEEGGGRGHWDQALAGLRQAKADAEARQSALDRLEKAEVPLLPDSFPWGTKDTSRPLTDLRTPLGAPLTPDKHAYCSGHAARLDEEFRPVWYCSDPAKHGHKLRPGAKQAKQSMSPEEKEARTRTIAGNKAWKAARTVREDFVKRLCKGKSLPEPVRQFALRTVMSPPYLYAKWCEKGETEAVAQFLGVPDPNADRSRYSRDGDPFDDLVSRQGKTKGWHQVFAQVAAAFEYSMREPKAWQGLGRHQAAYLLCLKAEGYRLSDVEELAVTKYLPQTDDEDQATEQAA